MRAIDPGFCHIRRRIAATATFGDRLLSLIITEAAGKESDAAEIVLDDRDGSIALPREGAKLAISLGYRETGLEYMGLFVVEEAEGSGFPRPLAITAKAADHRETFKEQKTRGWDQNPLGQIVGQIAGEHGLSAAVAGSLSARQIAQTEESDQHFLTRLAARFGAIAAAEAEARKIAREEGSISLEIAGRPAVLAEAPLTVSGVRTGAGGQWTIERVEHNYDPVYSRWQDLWRHHHRRQLHPSLRSRRHP